MTYGVFHTLRGRLVSDYASSLAAPSPVSAVSVLPNPPDNFTRWAEAIWAAGAQGAKTIYNLVHSAEFLNNRWTVCKEGSYTEYYYHYGNEKVGPFVRVNDSFSEIFFGHYQQNRLEGPFLQVQCGEAYLLGNFTAGQRHGTFCKLMPNKDVQTTNYSKGVLHGIYSQDTSTKRVTIPYVNGKKEGWATLTKTSGETRTELWQNDVLLDEQISDQNFPEARLKKQANGEWYLEWSFRQHSKDLPLEWYLESLSRSVRRVKPNPFSKFPETREGGPTPLPEEFRSIERGEKLWTSIEEKVRGVVIDILTNKYTEAKGELLRSYNWEIKVKNDGLLFDVNGVSDSKKIELVIDVLKNRILFTSLNDKAYVYHVGSYFHFEELSTANHRVAYHRITYLDSTHYYSMNPEESRPVGECIVKDNGDCIHLQRSPTTESYLLTNPRWPEMKVSMKRHLGKEEAVLIWVPKVPPQGKSVLTYVRALFGPPAANPPIVSAPPVSSVPPAAAGLAALVEEAIKIPIKRLRSVEELEPEKIIGIESRTLVWEHKQALLLNIELEAGAKKFAHFVEKARQKLAKLGLKNTEIPFSEEAKRTRFTVNIKYPVKLRRELTKFMFGTDQEVQGMLDVWQEHSFRMLRQDNGRYFFVTKGGLKGIYVKKNRYYSYGDFIEGKRQGLWTYLAANGNTAEKLYTSSKSDDDVSWWVLAEQNSQVKVMEVNEEPLELNLPEAKFTGVIVWKHRDFPRFVVSQTFTEGKSDSPPILRCKFSKLDGLDKKSLSAQAVRALEILTNPQG